MKELEFRGIKVIANEDLVHDIGESETLEFLEEVFENYSDVIENAKLIDLSDMDYIVVDGTKYQYIGGRLY